MFSKIVGFELKYRYSKWMTYIFMAMMIFQAAWYAKGTFEFYVNDAMNFNAAALFYQSLAGGGMLMVIAIAVITGNALFKDLDFKTAETFYSYPVNDKAWFLGKFTAAYIVNLSICLSYTLGFTVLQYTGIAEPDKFGPMPWGPLFHAFLIFSVPNMLIVTTIALSMVVFFRTMAASYMGVFMVTMIFLVAESTRENSAAVMVNYLMDPFCFTYTKDVMEALPVALKNYGYMQLDAVYWANRLLWVAISGILLLVATKRFSFSYFLTKPVSRKKTVEDNTETSFSPGFTLSSGKVFGIGESLKKIIRLSFLEFKNTVRPVGFKIILGILVLMFFGYNMLWNAEYYIHTDTLPITSAMTLTRLPNGVFILLLLAVFSGELLFKERSTNMWEITDVLPVPTWVTYLSKFIAMTGVAMLFALALLIPGLLAQIVQGFYEIEWSVYFNDLFSYHFGWLTYLMAIALAFFVGSLLAQRFVSHIITVGILLFIIVMADIGIIEQVRLMFPFTPGVEDYSEMAAYGTFGTAGRSYNIMWFTLSAALLTAGIWFWNRGSMQALVKRTSVRRTQLHFAGKIAIVLLLAVFFYMQYSVMANDHEHGNFKFDAIEDAEDAEYERLFKYIEAQNQPKVCGVDLIVDIAPDERKADYSFTMLLTNTGNTAIDSLHLSLKDFVVLHNAELNANEISASWYNEKHNQMVFYVPETLQPGDTATLSGACTFQYFGYSSSDPQEALVYNGSFLQEDILPYIGYNADKELDQNRTRGDEGLEKLISRMDPTDDSLSLQNNALSPNAILHKTTIKARTNNGQSLVATGLVKADETIDGKTYSVFETELSAAMKWQIAVADYKDYNATLSNNIGLHIKYDERHAYNLEHIKDAVDKGISFLSESLGDYPYSEVHLVEIPFYSDEDFYTTPNQIAISEKHCWTADGSREKDLSYIYYALCREVFAQWIQQNMQVADVQGADMILKALPEAYALAYVQQQFGDNILDIYLEKKQSRYGKGRGNESNSEPPLIYADGADYLEANKGALELLKIIQELGIDKVSETVKTFQYAASGKPVVFKDLYTDLKSMYSAEKTMALVAAFEEVKE